MSEVVLDFLTSILLQVSCLLMNILVNLVKTMSIDWIFIVRSLKFILSNLPVKMLFKVVWIDIVLVQ